MYHKRSRSRILSMNRCWNRNELCCKGKQCQKCSPVDVRAEIQMKSASHSDPPTVPPKHPSRGSAHPTLFIAYHNGVEIQMLKLHNTFGLQYPQPQLLHFGVYCFPRWLCTFVYMHIPTCSPEKSKGLDSIHLKKCLLFSGLSKCVMLCFHNIQDRTLVLLK